MELPLPCRTTLDEPGAELACQLAGDCEKPGEDSPMVRDTKRLALSCTGPLFSYATMVPVMNIVPSNKGAFRPLRDHAFAGHFKKWMVPQRGLR